MGIVSAKFFFIISLMIHIPDFPFLSTESKLSSGYAEQVMRPKDQYSC